MEELSHAIGKRIDEIAEGCPFNKLTSWWDRSCDLSLLIGTFYHGLGNYDVIFTDKTLPFESKRNSLENEILYNSEGTENVACISRSITSFFEPWKGNKAQKEDSSGRCVDKKIDVDAVDNVGVMIDDTNMSQDVDNSKDECNFLNPLKEFGLDLLCEKINKDLSAMIPKIGVPPIKKIIPSVELLNCRIKQLVSLIENQKSNKSTKIDQNVHNRMRDCQPGGNSPDSKGMSPTLSHFLEILGHEKLRYHVCFTNHFKGQIRHVNTLVWDNIEIPKGKRGCGLPKIISWFGLVGLLYADKRAVQQLVDTDIVIDEKNQRSSCSGPQQGSIFYGKVPTSIRDNEELRQCLFAGLLCCGMPSVPDRENSFHLHHVVNIALKLSISESSSQSHSLVEVQLYFTEILLPHCLRLTLHYEDNKSDNIQNGKDLETESEKCVLPDPMRKITEHSAPSCELASILLRRVKLCHAIQHIIKEDNIVQTVLAPILQSKKLLPKRNGSDVPIWWVPKIHDFALLEYASRNGLLTIVIDYKDQSHRLSQTVFERNCLEMHVRGVFFDDNRPIIPKFIQEKVSSEEITLLLSGQLKKFPSASVVEERLEFIVGNVCRSIISNGDGGENWAYYNLPSFD